MPVRQKFCEEVGELADRRERQMSGSTSMRSEVQVQPVNLPTKDWSWVMPEDDPYTREPVSGAAGKDSTTPPT